MIFESFERRDRTDPIRHLYENFLEAVTPEVPAVDLHGDALVDERQGRFLFGARINTYLSSKSIVQLSDELDLDLEEFYYPSRFGLRPPRVYERASRPSTSNRKLNDSALKIASLRLGARLLTRGCNVGLEYNLALSTKEEFVVSAVPVVASQEAFRVLKSR